MNARLVDSRRRFGDTYLGRGADSGDRRVVELSVQVVVEVDHHLFHRHEHTWFIMNFCASKRFVSTFIGLDLAWKATNESGICWLEGDTSADLVCRRLEAEACSVEDLADEIADIPGTVVVAIDAPLLYTPDRWVEKEVGRRFGRYKASAHSAHAAVRQGWRAGIDLGNALKQRGFTLDPVALEQEGSDRRAAVEVYPHTIHVRLFDLEFLGVRGRPTSADVRTDGIDAPWICRFK